MRKLAGRRAAPGGDEPRRRLAQRGDPAPLGSIRVDLEAAAANAAPLPELEEGDVVFVPKLQRKPVYISGLVAGKVVTVSLKPNQETRLLDVLAEAGGTSNYFADCVSVRREVPGRATPSLGVYSIKRHKSGGPDNIVLAWATTLK